MREKICKKCGNVFIHETARLGNFCSNKCRYGRNWTDEQKLHFSIAGKNSLKAKQSYELIKQRTEEKRKARII